MFLPGGRGLPVTGLSTVTWPGASPTNVTQFGISFQAQTEFCARTRELSVLSLQMKQYVRSSFFYSVVLTAETAQEARRLHLRGKAFFRILQGFNIVVTAVNKSQILTYLKLRCVGRLGGAVG